MLLRRFSRVRRSPSISGPIAPTSDRDRRSGPMRSAIRIRMLRTLPLNGSIPGASRWPAPFTLGDAQRNSVLSPGYADVDFVVAKDVRLPKNARLELRWEVFNLFNRANFDVPNRIFGTPNFGRIFSALPARQMQLGLKLQF